MEQLYPIRLLQEHAYAIVDYAAVGDLPETWPLVPLAPQGFDNETHLFPALLCVKEMSADQRMDLLERLDCAHEQHDALLVTTFLDSDADLERMRLHWTRQLIIRLPAGGRALLRSHDPRVFAQLRWMFTPAQLNALFGPIRRWTVYLDRRWQSVAAPASKAGLPPGAIRAEQGERLGRIGVINQVLSKLSEEQRREHEAVSRQIDALITRAASHALLREDEQIAFALHGMSVHPQFDRHPDIVRLLTEFDRKEQTYCDAAALLDVTQWQRIHKELTSRNETGTP